MRAISVIINSLYVNDSRGIHSAYNIGVNNAAVDTVSEQIADVYKLWSRETRLPRNCRPFIYAYNTLVLSPLFSESFKAKYGETT